MQRPVVALLVALLIIVAAGGGFIVGRISDDAPDSVLTPVRTGTVWVCGDRDDANGSCRSYTPIPVTSSGPAARLRGSRPASPSAQPSEYRGSARALLPQTQALPFPFWWIHREPMHGYRWKKTRLHSAWTAFYAAAMIRPHYGPPPGTAYADTIVIVFTSSRFARIYAARRHGAATRRQRTDYGATLWSNAFTVRDTGAAAWVTSVLRNVVTFSNGGGELRSGYTPTASRQDQIAIHRAIHRRVLALTR